MNVRDRKQVVKRYTVIRHSNSATYEMIAHNNKRALRPFYYSQSVLAGPARAGQKYKNGV